MGRGEHRRRGEMGGMGEMREGRERRDERDGRGERSIQDTRSKTILFCSLLLLLNILLGVLLSICMINHDCIS